MTRVLEEVLCFDVSPRSGVLKAGESVTLKLAYSSHSLDMDGNHSLPILVRIAAGRSLWLVLQGNTLRHDETFLHTTNGDEAVEALCPTPLGAALKNASIQSTEIINLGATDIAYEVSRR